MLNNKQPKARNGCEFNHVASKDFSLKSQMHFIVHTFHFTKQPPLKTLYCLHWNLSSVPTFTAFYTAPAKEEKNLKLATLPWVALFSTNLPKI